MAQATADACGSTLEPWLEFGLAGASSPGFLPTHLSGQAKADPREQQRAPAARASGRRGARRSRARERERLAVGPKRIENGRRLPANRSWPYLLMFAAAACVVVLARTAAAQGVTGTLIGTVKDAQSGVLTGATVRLTSPALIGGSATQTTNGKGNFVFPNCRRRHTCSRSSFTDSPPTARTISTSAQAPRSREPLCSLSPASRHPSLSRARDRASTRVTRDSGRDSASRTSRRFRHADRACSISSGPPRGSRRPRRRAAV